MLSLCPVLWKTRKTVGKGWGTAQLSMGLHPIPGVQEAHLGLILKETMKTTKDETFPSVKLKHKNHSFLTLFQLNSSLTQAAFGVEPHPSTCHEECQQKTDRWIEGEFKILKSSALVNARQLSKDQHLDCPRVSWDVVRTRARIRMCVFLLSGLHASVLSVALCKVISLFLLQYVLRQWRKSKLPIFLHLPKLICRT